MAKTKTLILGVTVIIALLLLSMTGYSRERQKKNESKEKTEVAKKDTYGDLVKKAKVAEGMIKILTVENDYYFESVGSALRVE